MPFSLFTSSWLRPPCFDKLSLVRVFLQRTGLVISYLLFSLLTQAQLPSIVWEKSIGGNQSEFGASIDTTSDGGFIVAGTTSSTSGLVSGFHGETDIWIVKLNSSGDVEWQKCLGGSRAEVAMAIRQTDEGGYIVTGYSNSTDGDVTGGSVNTSCWIVKLSATGVIEWQKVMGNSMYRGTGIALSVDGGYLVAGSSSDPGEYSDYSVVKLSATGIVEWQKHYGGSGSDEANAVIECSDGGYILSGDTNSPDGDVIGFHGPGDEDIWVVKISSAGDIVWQVCLGTIYWELGGYKIRQTEDGGYMVVGSTNYPEQPGQNADNDAWVVKLSATGIVEWQKQMGGSLGDYAYDIRQTDDGGYLVACQTYSSDGNVDGSYGGPDYWLVKLSAEGNIESQRCFGGSGVDLLNAVLINADKSIILAGNSQSVDGNVTGGYGNGDLWIVKLVGKTTVLDLKIDTIAGRILKRPIAGVVVEAWLNGSVSASVISDAEGHYSFTGLNNGSLYTLKFHYQDEYGINDNIYADYEFSGYKPGDNIPDIQLPYSMLRQLRQLQNKTLTKPNYEIKYLLDILDFTGFNPRKTYDLNLVESLIDDWQTIDKLQAPDVINNMGRVYLSLYACNELADDAYRLSEIPAKAVSELFMGVLGILKTSQKIKNVAKKETAPNPSLPASFSSDVVSLNEKMARSVGSLAIKGVSQILKLRLETIADPEEKELIGLQLKGLSVVAKLISGDKYDLTISTVLDLLKSLLANEMFVYIYEQHITKTQELISSTYNKASLLAPPDQTFEIAARKIMVSNGVSLVHAAHLKTDEVVDLCNNVFFNNVDKLEMVESVTKAFEDISPFLGSENADIAAASLAGKSVSWLTESFKMINYGAALYFSYDRLSKNRKEQRYAPIFSFTPDASVAFRSSAKKPDVRYASSSGYFSFQELQEEVTRYQERLDSVIQLIREHQNTLAIKKAIDLVILDSSLSKKADMAAKEIAVFAPAAVSQISSFDNIYLNEFAVKYQATCFSRAGMALNLNTWFLDTLSVSFIDTLEQFAYLTNISNQEFISGLEYIQSITSLIDLPAKVMVADITAPAEMGAGADVPVVFSIKNYGSSTATSVRLKFNADRGFTFNSDSVYIGDMAPGEVIDLTLQLKAPLTDTFTVYTAQTLVGNGEGGLEVNHINSLSEVVLPLTLLSFKAVEDRDIVDLSWSTSGEVNTDHFIIERKDKGSYISIGKVRASEMSSRINKYQFFDNKPVNGLNYYRLKMVDKDGQFTYSKVVVLSFNTHSKVVIFPNPTYGDINIRGLKDGVEKVIGLYDSYGKLIERVQTSRSTHVFNIKGRQGVYWLAIRSDDMQEVHKIVVASD